jgi:hypothetical protein
MSEIKSQNNQGPLRANTEGQYDFEIRELLKKNLQLTEEIHAYTRKIKKYMAWQRLVSVFYFIIIVGPIILSIFFLPPIIKSWFGQYQSLLGSAASSSLTSDVLNSGLSGQALPNLDGLDIQGLLNQLKVLQTKQ